MKHDEDGRVIDAMVDDLGKTTRKTLTQIEKMYEEIGSHISSTCYLSCPHCEWVITMTVNEAIRYTKNGYPECLLCGRKSVTKRKD